MLCVPLNFLNFGATIYYTTKIKSNLILFMLNELSNEKTIEFKLINLKKITNID